MTLIVFGAIALLVLVFADDHLSDEAHLTLDALAVVLIFLGVLAELL